jgi:hypothetical protein
MAIESSAMRWAGHVACMGAVRIHNFIRESEGLRDLRIEWEDTILKKLEVTALI